MIYEEDNDYSMSIYIYKGNRRYKYKSINQNINCKKYPEIKDICEKTRDKLFILNTETVPKLKKDLMDFKKTSIN